LSWQSAFPSLPTFSLPIDVRHAGDGTNRLFVAQQRGMIYVFQNSPTVSTRRVFIDLSDRVSQSGSETGLLGLAFHPNYATNGFFFVNYTSSISGSLRSYIDRYQVSATNPDSAVRSSQFQILSLAQPYSNHNGGSIAFGPDGFLYLGFGDGGSGNDPGNRAQNRAELLGKILRIDVDRTTVTTNYAIPSTNPFFGNTQGWREEIFAYGLRNPWKFSFDAQTGDIWCGDVGQDTREEIDIITIGGNFGWRLMEGFICTPGVNPGCADTAGLIRPVWDYPNAGSDISVTGGYVYRGAAIPSVQGKYFCADYGSGKIWMLTRTGPNSATAQLVSDEAYSISSFGVDQTNELYLLSYSSAGRLYKLNGPSTNTGEEPSPRQFMLEQNYPNPFNPTTTLSFVIGKSSWVTLKVFDVLGNNVATIVDGFLTEGEYARSFDASRLASGVYYYQLKSSAFLATKRMVLLR
jgi:glucose/arabinose dehydrogenase